MNWLLGKLRGLKKFLVGELRSLRTFLGGVPWLGALLPACVVLVSGGWVADGLKGEVLFAKLMSWLGIPVHWWPGMVVASLCFLGYTLVLYANRRAFVPMLNLSRHRCDPHRSLVLFVSVSPPDIEFESKPDGDTGPFPITVKRTSRIGTIEAEATIKGECLNEDINVLDVDKLNWTGSRCCGRSSPTPIH